MVGVVPRVTILDELVDRHQSRPTFPRKMMESALMRRWTQLSAKIMTHVESHGGALAGDPVVCRSALVGR
jgi:hypothetical protein